MDDERTKVCDEILVALKAEHDRYRNDANHWEKFNDHALSEYNHLKADTLMRAIGIVMDIKVPD